MIYFHPSPLPPPLSESPSLSPPIPAACASRRPSSSSSSSLSLSLSFLPPSFPFHHDSSSGSAQGLAGLAVGVTEDLTQMRCDGMASPFFSPSFLLQMQTPHEEEGRHPPSSLSPLLPSTTPCANVQDFHGLAALLGKRSGSFSAVAAEPCEEMNGEEDLSDDCSVAAGEKKRRLNVEQVRMLERNFEMGNKLEPERKMQLARALGLQPRQVAIWFQNRRARWKTKQLEKDYEELKRQVEAIREENDALQAQNKKLEAEIMALRGREVSEPINLNKETEGSCSNRSDNSSDINLDISRTPATESRMDAHHGRPFFPTVRPTPTVAQLLQYPPLRPELPQCPKVEHGGAAPHDETFGNMFSGLDDQPGFCWAWSEQHTFH